jgi:DNA-binding NarL/FixJ family response regulator
MPISVVIAENHTITRRGVRAMVTQRQEAVVATADTGLDALSVVEEHKPDVLVLGLDLPHVTGFDVLRHIQRRTLAVEVMVLTTHTEPHHVRTVFERGATAYALKQDPISELESAFEATVEGRRYLSPSLDGAVEDESVREPKAKPPYRSLSRRQREVLRLTAEGYTGTEAAAELDISPRTVEGHRRRIREELGLRNVVEMTRYAVHVGLYATPRSDWLDRTVQS